MRIVVAVGGNALIRAGGEGTWPEQLRNAHEIAEAVLALRAAGHAVVLTHGNGPQVGALLLHNALDEAGAPPLPLDALIAMTQGQIGYLLESAFAAIDPTVPIAVLLTRVLVDRADPAFRMPTKPVGPFYSAEEARRRAAALGWDVASDAGRGWRRVVPSPHPRKVFGEEHIGSLLDHGAIVIACGGGGIPVAAGEGEVVGVAGVIDKDRCSARLAIDIGADLLVLLTGVRRVALDFGTRWERELARLTISDAARGLADGDFPAGSMGPKMESAGTFVEESGGRALVTSAERLAAAVAGEDGTWIVADADGPSVTAEGAVWA
jgi:carbamate kinase